MTAQVVDLASRRQVDPDVLVLPTDLACRVAARHARRDRADLLLGAALACLLCVSWSALMLVAAWHGRGHAVLVLLALTAGAGVDLIVWRMMRAVAGHG